MLNAGKGELRFGQELCFSFVVLLRVRHGDAAADAEASLLYRD